MIPRTKHDTPQVKLTFTGSNVRNFFLYILNLIQGSCKHFVSVTHISVGSCKHRYAPWGGQVSPCISPAKLYQTLQYRPPASTQTSFFELKHSSDSSSSKSLTALLVTVWLAQLLRGAKHRHCSSSALVSANSNLLPLWTARRFPVPHSGTPGIPATGNSLMISVFLLHRR